MVLMNTSIKEFHEEHYRPAIRKLAHHLPHVKILGSNHCAKIRQEAMKRRSKFRDAIARRDYAERLVAKFMNQIQSMHFGGKRSLSMEGCAVQQYRSRFVDALSDPAQDEALKSVFILS